MGNGANVTVLDDGVLTSEVTYGDSQYMQFLVPKKAALKPYKLRVLPDGKGYEVKKNHVVVYTRVKLADGGSITITRLFPARQTEMVALHKAAVKAGLKVKPLAVTVSSGLTLEALRRNTLEVEDNGDVDSQVSALVDDD